MDTRSLTITGIGVHERMLPGFIRGPHGTGDYLFMLFHDESMPRATARGAMRFRRKQ